MPTFITDGFVTWDAGAAGGAVDVSDRLELAETVLDDVKADVPFAPWGAGRSTNFPGLINASVLAAKYIPVTDTSDQQYEDLIAAFYDAVLQTVIIRPDDAVVALTNHQVTITGYLMNAPTGGWVHGEFISYPSDINVHSVVHFDSVTTFST